MLHMNMHICYLSCKFYFLLCMIAVVFPLHVKAGMISFALRSATSSAIKKPWSAITSSVGSSLSRKPLCCVSSLSDTLPPQHFDTKEIVPDGVIAIKNLTVLCFFCNWKMFLLWPAWKLDAL